MRRLAGLFLITLLVWSVTSPAKVAARGSRKIQKTYGSSLAANGPQKKRVDAAAATTFTTASLSTTGVQTPSIPGYTPSAPIPTAASTGVAAKEPSNFDPSAILGMLSGLGGGGNQNGQNGNAGTAAGSPSSGSPGGSAPVQRATYAPQDSYQSAGLTSGNSNSINKSLTDSYNANDSLAGGGMFGQASCGKTQATLVTHYGSDASKYASAAEALMEGGEQDRFGGMLNSVEQAARNGRPVSLAGDATGTFGARCNSSASKSCLMLVCYENFDSVFPEYRARFPNVQKNCLIGAIVDTGNAFTGSEGGKIDVATRDIEKARKISAHGRYYEIETLGCNSGSGDKRKCQVENITASCSTENPQVAGSQTRRRTAGLQ